MIRTRGILLPKQARYQLRYTPKRRFQNAYLLYPTRQEKSRAKRAGIAPERYKAKSSGSDTCGKCKAVQTASERTAAQNGLKNNKNRRAAQKYAARRENLLRKLRKEPCRTKLIFRRTRENAGVRIRALPDCFQSAPAFREPLRALLFRLPPRRRGLLPGIPRWTAFRR